MSSIDALTANRDCSKDCIDDVTSPHLFDVHEAHCQLIRPDHSVFRGHLNIY